MKLRIVGLLLFPCDRTGTLLSNATSDGDLLIDTLSGSESFQRLLKTQASRWEEHEDPEAVEAMPGMWFLPLPIRIRRRCTGYNVVVIATPDLIDSRELEELCRSSNVDFKRINVELSALPPAPTTEIDRLSRLVRTMYHDHITIRGDQEVIENIGQQLADSYEEINLLYTITQSITKVDQPEQFVAIACRELLATLPYTWIGVQLADDPDRLKSLNQRFIATGDPGQMHETLSALAQELLKQAEPDRPMILEPGLKSDHSYLLSMGRTVLAFPIMRDGKAIGLLIAGGKQGADQRVSSSDIKLVGATASHLAIFMENAALYDDLSTMFMGTLEALTSAIDAKDRYTCGHSQRVAFLSKQLAHAAGLDPYTIGRVHVAGLVHDVGKIGVPEIVLTKPGRLTKEEFDLIKKHPEIGYRILKDIPQLSDILPGVLHHHESWDGRGYPHGLVGEEIPLMGRLIALADSFDAMSSTRTYRSAMTREEVLEEIDRCTGTQFDPQLAPIFVRLDFAEYEQMTLRQHERDLREGRFGGQAA
ncbi:MAG: HD domain-containing protein [Planctomycetota bacterium]|nr:HD domain-containing protein [Planctomycetota bacterium]